MAPRPTLDTSNLPARILTDEEEDQSVVPIPEEVGEEVEELDYVENEDGSVTLLDKETEEEETSSSEDGFYDNLVEEFDADKLKAYCLRLNDRIVRDKDARSKRDEQYEEGLRRTGLGKDAPGGAQFEGASKVVHPILAEGSIDYASRTLKEVCPPDGPVKPAPYVDEELPESDKSQMQELARRKAKYMNWQLLKQIREFKPELERALTQEPMAGNSYLLWWWENGRPHCEFVPVDRVWLPFEASGWYTASRRTLLLTPDEQHFQAQVDAGYYVEAETLPEAQPDETKSQQAQNKIEGKEDPGLPSDGTRRLLRVEINEIFDEDKEAGGATRPYVLVMDENTSQPLRLERNWEQDDPQAESMDWVVPFGFIPWSGAYDIGFPHLIGGMSAALTGSLRALLDSAHINNASTALKLKSSKTSGQNQKIIIGQVNEIDAGAGVDDIRKQFMPMPFNPPSEVLYKLFLDIDKLARGVVRTALDEVAEQGTNVPVGTQMSRVEQALVVFSTIHGRQHGSMGKCIEIVHRLNKYNLEEQTVVRELGSLVVSREDFAGPCDVGPASDPNVFSEMQRMSQVQILAARAENPASAKYYDGLKVEKFILKHSKIKDAEDFLIQDPDPEDTDPINENVQATLGKRIKVYDHQDHEMHLAVHAAYMEGLAATPLMAMPGLPQLLAHIKEHLAYMYRHEIGQDLALTIHTAQMYGMQPPEERKVLMAAARGSMQRFQKEMEMLNPLITKSMEIISRMQPPNPENQANQAQLMSAQAQLKAVEVAQFKAQSEAKTKELETQFKAQEAAAKAKLQQLEQTFNARTAEQANKLAEAELRVKVFSEVVTAVLGEMKLALEAGGMQQDAMNAEAERGEQRAEREANKTTSFNEQIMSRIDQLMTQRTQDLEERAESIEPEIGEDGFMSGVTVGLGPTKRKLSAQKADDGRLQQLTDEAGNGYMVIRDAAGNFAGLRPVNVPKETV